MVVVPNYALCPAVGIEHIVLQLTRCLAWVHRHAALYGGDPARITSSRPGRPGWSERWRSG